MSHEWEGKPKLYIAPYYHHDGREEAGWFGVFPWGGAEYLGTVQKTDLRDLIYEWWHRYMRGIQKRFPAIDISKLIP